MYRSRPGSEVSEDERELKALVLQCLLQDEYCKRTGKRKKRRTLAYARGRRFFVDN